MPASRQSAIRFIVALGTISLFADVTYEGARSINGPFLGTLGASAAVVGIVSGAGELAGYLLRLFSGFAVDRTRAYWTLTIVGYTINLLAVPCMALAGHWGFAAALIIAERAGKAVRTPARDVMLSQASKIVGRGWGFGLHEFMDQLGAFMGPLLVAAGNHRIASISARLRGARYSRRSRIGQFVYGHQVLSRSFALRRSEVPPKSPPAACPARSGCIWPRPDCWPRASWISR